VATKTRKTYSPADREAARKTRAEKVEQMHATLTDAVAALAESGEWQRWLDFLGSFHAYSFKNTILILSQCPHATQVAGFKAWQSKGRQVRKGEKGIRIFGKPFRTVTETDEKTGEETRSTVSCPPPVVTVFDHSQTDPIDGVEQHECPARPLEGDDPASLYTRVADYMTEKGWTVTREAIPGETNGYCVVDGSRRIVLDDALSAAHTAKTMIHEAAHALMHTDDDGKALADIPGPIREVEAESVAYVLAGLAGLDTSGYSVGYLTGWSKGDTDALTTTAVRVQATVHQLAEAITLDEQ